MSWTNLMITSELYNVLAPDIPWLKCGTQRVQDTSSFRCALNGLVFCAGSCVIVHSYRHHQVVHLCEKVIRGLLYAENIWSFTSECPVKFIKLAFYYNAGCLGP